MGSGKGEDIIGDKGEDIRGGGNGEGEDIVIHTTLPTLVGEGELATGNPEVNI